MIRSIPLTKALDADTLIAFGMNDAPLPPAHGFPARLIVPGLYGYVSATKWLTEIELTTWEAFAVGLPVVTWPGDLMRGRISAADFSGQSQGIRQGLGGAAAVRRPG